MLITNRFQDVINQTLPGVFHWWPKKRGKQRAQNRCQTKFFLSTSTQSLHKKNGTHFDPRPQHFRTPLSPRQHLDHQIKHGPGGWHRQNFREFLDLDLKSGEPATPPTPPPILFALEPCWPCRHAKPIPQPTPSQPPQGWIKNVLNDNKNFVGSKTRLKMLFFIPSAP